MIRELTLPYLAQVRHILVEKNGLILSGHFRTAGLVYAAVKIDSDGKVLWEAEIMRGETNSVDDYGCKIIPASDGYYLGFSFSYQRKMFVVKFDLSGTTIWRTEVNVEYSDISDLAFDPSGILWVQLKGATILPMKKPGLHL